ncbi:hypothetical protein YC2023_066647 [Brassica napus]
MVKGKAMSRYGGEGLLVLELLGSMTENLEEEAEMELVPWEMRIWKCDWLNQLRSGYAKAHRRRTRLVSEASEAEAYRSAPE